MEPREYTSRPRQISRDGGFLVVVTRISIPKPFKITFIAIKEANKGEFSGIDTHPE